MKMQTFPGARRSMLLAVLISLATTGHVAAQDTPAAEEAPPPSAETATAQDGTTPAADAQTSSSGASQAPDAAPPMPGSSQVATRSDGEILQALKVLSEAEISQAELAIEEASSQEVKDAAQQIFAQHSNTLEQIGTLASATGVNLTESPLSAELLERSEATIDDLESLSGSEFECTYLQQKAADHQFALDTVDYELLPFAKSFSVRNLLSEAAPRFEEQAVAARETHASLDSCG